MGLFSRKIPPEPAAPSDRLLCPLLNKPCIMGACTFWTHVVGSAPQTGEVLDHFDCAVKWLPMLLIDNTKQVKSGTAEVSAMRSEVVVQQTGIGQAMGFLASVANEAREERKKLK